MKRIASDSIKFRVDDEGRQRLAFAEVLVPDVLNVYGDFHTKEDIRRFAYEFAINGFAIDRNHNHTDVSSKVRIVEYFVARDNDPDFIPGSWVVGIHVLDDDIWNDILSGELNGFSYEALVSVLPVEINVPYSPDIAGVTLPDVDDGHVHQFYVRLNDKGRVVAGGTTVVNGHSHTISRHTFTDMDSGETHKHRFVIYEDEANDAA